MRTALLPTPGDPFMVAYWLRNFETWRDQVDELIVLVNGQTDGVILDQIKRQVTNVGGTIHTTEHRIGHAQSMNWLLEFCQTEHFVMCEDDAYVRRPDAIGAHFYRIENGVTDLVGSPRHEDYAGQYQEWGPYVPGDLAELRHGLWPAFLFGRRDDLLATDRAFGDRLWRLGENVAGWGPVTQEAVDFIGLYPDAIHLDTFFGTTFQLRAKGLRTELVHHVRTYDAQATEEWIAEDPPWFHVTNLSTLDQVLSGQPVETIPDIGNREQWARRIAWWLRTTDVDSGLAGGERRIALWQFAERAGITQDSFLAWDALFDRYAPYPVPA